MSNIVEKAAEGAVNTAKDLVKKPVSWFKGSKIAFVIFVLVLVVLAIRYRDVIAQWLYRLGPPGRWVVGKLNQPTTG